MTKAAVLLHGGSSYVLGDKAELFTSLDDARHLYQTCEQFGFDPRTKLGTPCWGDGREPGDEVGWAWKHDHDNNEVAEAEASGAPVTVERSSLAESPDYVLVKLPRGGYKWHKVAA